MIRFKSTHFTRNAFENGFPIGYPWLNFPMYMYMSYIYHFFKHWLNKKCFRNIHAPPTHGAKFKITTYVQGIINLELRTRQN